MHCYQPSFNPSEDDSYMGVIMAITRISELRQGSMGYILVNPSQKESSADDGEDNINTHRNNDRESDHADSLFSRIVAAATITSFSNRTTAMSTSKSTPSAKLQNNNTLNSTPHNAQP